MNKTENGVSKTLLSIFVIVIVVTLVSLMGILRISFAADTTATSSTATTPVIAEGELDPDAYSYYINTGEFEATENSGAPSYIPRYGDFQIYCIEPGNGNDYTYSISYEDALAMVGDTYSSDCMIYNGCADTPREGEMTLPVYTSVGVYTLPVAAAYIVSDETIGEWTMEKQKAIWNLRDTGLDDGMIVGDGTSTAAGPTIYDQEAQDYAEYDALVRDIGLVPIDTTDLDEVKVGVDTVAKEYIVGPFSVDYTSGIYGDIAFAGISEITIVGYNSALEEVRDDIELKGLILADEATGIMGTTRVEPEYFEPSNDLKVDETEQVYPNPGQEFKVIFDDPNANLDEDDPDRVAYIAIKIKFKYMLANGEYTELQGTKYIVSYEHNHAYNSHTHEHYGCHSTSDGYECHHSESDTGCETTCYLAETSQQWAIAADAIRTIYEQEIIIGIEISDNNNDDDDDTNTPAYNSTNTPGLSTGDDDDDTNTPTTNTPGKIPGDGDDDDDDDDDDYTTPTPIPITMDLGGTVWEDGVSGKESEADGVSNTSGDNIDIPLANIKVTLYTEDGEIANLMSDASEGGLSDEEIMYRVNPTYTDENGNYMFQGLNPMKKYYVVFEYNGQLYLPTEYLNTSGGQYSSVEEMVNAGLYNTDSWSVTSKGTEASNSSSVEGVEISRNDFDTRFSEIRSYPENYPSSNNLGVGTYNAVYTQLELMGYTLDDNGKYSQTETQLIDGYTYDENGLETDTYSQGVISTKIREYILANLEYPDESAMLGIYNEIAGGDAETLRKLQFIEDCQIQAYTGSAFTEEIDYYPVYDYFIINDNGVNYTTIEEAQNATYDMSTFTFEGNTYEPIYSGQFFVNLGLWRRQEFDATIRKDLYKATLTINGKTVVYDYDERDTIKNDADDGVNSADGADNDTWWDINVRIQDYDLYYGAEYNREIYESDYLFNTSGGLADGHPGEALEIYITYKITVRNQSMSILGEIQELVDFYDNDYTYRDDLSWITYDRTVDDDEFYDAMVAGNTSLITNSQDVNSNTESKYGSSTQSDIVTNGEYQAIYINGLQGKKLASGESAYIYLTFQVNKDSNGRVILDAGSYATDESPKENLVEINGFSTYYKDGTSLPNGVTKGESDIAGLLDRDSNPGNLVSEDLEGDKYEKNFEDDTDRAPSLRVIIDDGAVRQANGVVWEDERTETSGDAIIGDGIRQDGEIGIAGVTVTLLELCTDGSEFPWYTTTTNSDGSYEFTEGFIPGDYIIVFQYGDTTATVATTDNGGSNVTSYNGQDFKSTTYQVGIDQNGATDLDEAYYGYTDVENQNARGEYGYNIYAADSAGENYSDAKDIWKRREEVIAYSDYNVTNSKAEILASPYTGETGLFSDLITYTSMIAETGVIVVEVEYNRQQTAGDNTVSNGSEYLNGNDVNGNYVLNNIDFGLTERPKAQLEIDKAVERVQVTLSNGTILFDIVASANNAIWLDHEEYNISEYLEDNGGKYEDYYGSDHRYAFRDTVDDIVTNQRDRGLIQLTMDEELMHGATIEITYTIKITNAGETDYDSKTFYYTGNASGDVVTTTPELVIDYVANNLQFDANDATNSADGWAVVDMSTLNVKSSVTEALNQSPLNTIITTTNFAEALEPGATVTKTLILSKIITTQNSDDDLVYENIVEILSTSNTVGRRMAFSIVGNQDPTASPAEVDSSTAERVIILPPFGIGETITYIAIALVVGAILVVGIILIKKKVLNVKKS